MAAVGGDLQTLRNLYKKFVDAANQTNQLSTSVTSALHSTVWTGPNSVKFKSEWDQFRKTLAQIQQALIDGSNDVKNQHNNIAAATGAVDRI